MADDSKGFVFPSTQTSLLTRLQSGTDDAAWAEFVEKYGVVVLRWCRNRIKKDELAKEIALDLLIDLPRRLRKFQLGKDAGRFRGWLHVVVERACTDLLRKHQRERTALAQLVAADSMDELKHQLNQLFDQEIYDLACNAVRQRIEQHPQGNEKTWAAYVLTAPVEFFRGNGLTNEQAAGILLVEVSFIEKARSNVKKMLAEEILVLEKD